MNRMIRYSDQELISFARQGRREAYEQLFARYEIKVQQMICLHRLDPAAVKDLAHEVLLKAYRNLPYFKEDSQFSTWIYRIVKNTLKNHYRSLATHQNLELEYIENNEGSNRFSPESLVSSMEFDAQLQRALSDLPDELRSCYCMHVYEDKTYDDIAQKMRCPIGTVRSRISRARKLLCVAIGNNPSVDSHN